MSNKKALLPAVVIILIAALCLNTNIYAQETGLVVRIAKLQIDSTRLDAYKKALKIQAETAIRAEPGVLNLYAVYEKNNPAHVTVFEIYANEDAYKEHLRTPHFLKYKASTSQMVKSLELIETVPIALETKYKKPN